MSERDPCGRVTLRSDGVHRQAVCAGQSLADSRATLVVDETGYPPVVYFPRADVDMTLLERTTHRSRCPYKGEASYFSARLAGRVEENVAWSYETPIPAVAGLKECIAFYADRVELREAAD